MDERDRGRAQSAQGVYRKFDFMYDEEKVEKLRRAFASILIITPEAACPRPSKR